MEREWSTRCHLRKGSRFLNMGILGQWEHNQFVGCQVMILSSSFPTQMQLQVLHHFKNSINLLRGDKCMQPRPVFHQNPVFPSLLQCFPHNYFFTPGCVAACITCLVFELKVTKCFVKTQRTTTDWKNGGYSLAKRRKKNCLWIPESRERVCVCVKG